MVCLSHPLDKKKRGHKANVQESLIDSNNIKKLSFPIDEDNPSVGCFNSIFYLNIKAKKP